MPPPELRMSFDDQAALARELDSNLKHGRAFVLGAGGVEALVDCVLVLVHPDGGREFGLRGQVVMVSDSEPMRGVGIQLRPFDADVLRMVQAFVDGDPAAVGTAEVRRTEPPAEVGAVAETEAAFEAETEAETETEAESESEAESDAESEADSESESETESGEGTGALLGDGEQDEDGGRGSPDLQHGPARHERLRKLNVTQQNKLARFGELNDRVMLERIYGKAVWEGLLQNPKLTLPEVARIARKGSAPRPLIEQIVDTPAWIQSPLVRRALLTNPRVSGEGILKLLRITPRPELKVICKTNTYSTQVREAARKVLDM